MQKLINVQYRGFALGLRIADSYATQVSVYDENAVAGLHAIKGILHQIGLCDEIKTLGFNGEIYVIEEELNK